MAEMGFVPGFVWRFGLFLPSPGEGDQGSGRALSDGKLDLVGCRYSGSSDIVCFSDLAECPRPGTFLGKD